MTVDLISLFDAAVASDSDSAQTPSQQTSCCEHNTPNHATCSMRHSSPFTLGFCYLLVLTFFFCSRSSEFRHRILPFLHRRRSGNVYRFSLQVLLSLPRTTSFLPPTPTLFLMVKPHCGATCCIVLLDERQVKALQTLIARCYRKIRTRFQLYGKLFKAQLYTEIAEWASEGLEWRHSGSTSPIG